MKTHHALEAGSARCAGRSGCGAEWREGTAVVGEESSVVGAEHRAPSGWVRDCASDRGGSLALPLSEMGNHWRILNRRVSGVTNF